ncbi:MAG TPA: hypothetical protein VN450_06135 [Candidatus Methylomirabilis sp.]|nr:hypothetical protein [Candidatus Methylomirabilis sp.]
MQLHSRIRLLAMPSMAVLSVFFLLTGCAAGKRAATMADSPHAKAELPKEIEVSLRLSPGDEWKSRFVSTSEMKRTLTGADGKESVKARTVGIELTATQKVVYVSATVARVEVTESETRILQDGKFVPAPYKQFNPPNPVVFTIDTATGKTDFSELRKAYEKWMADLKEGPAGDIIGKTFRLPAYLASIEDTYGKPFTRVSGRKLSAEEKPSGKDVILPFLGPGAALASVPVEGMMRYTAFETKGRKHLLNVSGSYTGQPDLSSADELAVRLSDFGRAAPKSFTGSGSAAGRFQSSVDLLSGREERATAQLSYTAKWMFDGVTLTEEVVGKSILEPAE